MGLEALLSFCSVPVSHTQDGHGKRRKSFSELDLLHADDDVDTECPSGRFSSHGSTASGSGSGVVTKSDVHSLMGEVASTVQPWRNEDFTLVQEMQEAPGNFGHVNLMRQSEALGGGLVAVKKMPNHWVMASPVEFQERNPKAAELPWVDLAILKQLNKSRFPYSCDLGGVFRDHTSTYVVTSYNAGGDLFAWCKREDPEPGTSREALMQPLVTQIASAVKWLHELGIAHRDLSLENIMLTGTDNDLQIKLIDFGMATVARTCKGEVRGKLAYRAPEMHMEAPYDSFLIDAFSLGVVVFAMAARDYPWTSTKRGNCRFFEYVSKFGFRQFVSKRKLRGGTVYLGEVFSEDLVDLLDGLLELQPERRTTLGEAGWEDRSSLWTTRWMSR